MYFFVPFCKKHQYSVRSKIYKYNTDFLNVSKPQRVKILESTQTHA